MTRAQDLERTLPYSADAERAVLGAILLDNAALNVASAAIQAGDFFLPQNRKIFEAMVELASFYQPVDLVMLGDLLERHGELEAAGGPGYLAQLMDGLPRGTNIEHYSRLVKEKSVLRSLIRSAEVLQERAFDGDIVSATLEAANAAAQATALKGNANDWRPMFHTAEDFKNAPPLRFAIQDFLQLDGATLFGGLSGHGKTFVMLAVVKALLSREKLFGYFEVREMSARIVYLIPESSIGPFGHRLKLFKLERYLENERLLVRTLSAGATPCLSDPRILSAAKGADVFLDTAVRFVAEGDENSASDNQRGLARDIFTLLGAGARLVGGAHHSAKPFAKENVMTLENVLRGSGDVGAMVATAWGIKQLDPEQNLIHLENVKSRDFQPPGPFQIVGRPWIDQEGDFRMLKKPGECGRLADEQDAERDKGGAPVLVREARAANLALLQSWLAEDPAQTSEELAKRFKDSGVKVSSVTVRKYKQELKSSTVF